MQMNQRQKRQILVDRYLDFYGMALAILRDTDDAKDAVQEALVKTLAKRHVADPAAYCSRAVRNECITTLRRRSRTGLASCIEMLGLSLADTPPDMLPERAMQLTDELSEVDKALVNLHDIEGMTYDELALLTGSSATQIRRIVAGAHQYLKKRLMEEQDEN